VQGFVVRGVKRKRQDENKHTGVIMSYDKIVRAFKQSVLPLRRFRRQGGVISVAYAMAIILMLFVLSNVLLSTIGGDLRSSSNRLLQARVFYAAESGLEMALKNLQAQGSGVLSNLNINGVTVSTSVVNDTVLQSTATASGMTRTLHIYFHQTDGWPQAFHYAVSMFNSGYPLNFQGSHAKYLDGDIFSYTQQYISFASGLGIGAVTVHLPENVFIENHTGYSIGVVHFPAGTTPVQWPALNTSYYDNLINNVNGYANQSNYIGTDLNLSDYPDGVYYYNGGHCGMHNRLLIENATITGPGIIVSPREIYVNNAVIGPNVQIISGDRVKIRGGSQLTGSGTVVYADYVVEIRDNYTSVTGSILSPNEVTIDCSMDLSKRGSIVGVIYAGARVSVKHAKIFGSIVTQYFNYNEVKCTYLYYGNQYLPSEIPPGISSGQPSVTTVSGSWGE